MQAGRLPYISPVPSIVLISPYKHYINPRKRCSFYAYFIGVRNLEAGRFSNLFKAVKWQSRTPKSLISTTALGWKPALKKHEYFRQNKAYLGSFLLKVQKRPEWIWSTILCSSSHLWKSCSKSEVFLGIPHCSQEGWGSKHPSYTKQSARWTEDCWVVLHCARGRTLGGKRTVFMTNHQALKDGSQVVLMENHRIKA